MVRCRECLKNHAVAMGGNATDGCGEFMPSGEEGNIEALNCSTCNCHTNFHRKEIEGEPSSWDCYHSPQHINRIGRKVILRHHHKNLIAPGAFGYPTNKH
ncbi:ZF-HD_dimer domain-containing protein [Cephalotus follicularis]|uniref:ZF-HD_dimer domain-containing protein n=1 Tax=Cephalotus follicularis TaxID=3775 RepID=A0A1Q3D361_CEPFO|nr:ZF-HD_dimer domain-containing protein [Cephalotus follicularis]